MSIGEFFKKAHSICEKHIGKCTECPLDEYCSDGIFNNTEVDILTLVKIVNTEADQSEEPPKAGKWIPCSERLPEESLNSVIGWDEYRKRCCFVQYYGGQWQLAGKNKYGESVKIIAWQPVPEPYKMKGE